ncbi:hypothetical protein Dsin_029439 [Dipteronia sinensis]|uniref:Polygalacturonase n=1 Tax=Dipteronia sinensis TaxID=43782 RepID=A0AAE0DV73_9ROSI|nr:hypothetical protein Dsin_029439 [Dipteronia sinensis]
MPSNGFPKCVRVIDQLICQYVPHLRHYIIMLIVINVAGSLQTLESLKQLVIFHEYNTTFFARNKTITIGSLGQDMKEDGVQNVTVKNATFIGTQNGLRIKTWARPSNGFVQGVQFIGAFMYYVENPIVIDQSYCPHDLNCPGQVSGIQISDVTFQDIRGVSIEPIAIKFDCSVKYPCKGIKLQNVNLKYLKQEAQSSCTNVMGEALGLVKPDGCL